MSDTKYPKINVKLSGEDGNAFAVIGAVREALKRGGVSTDEQAQFAADAMSGDYDNVIQTAMKWVSVS